MGIPVKLSFNERKLIVINKENKMLFSLLVKKTGYVLFGKSNLKSKEFPAEVTDSIKGDDSVYLILKNGYKKIK